MKHVISISSKSRKVRKYLFITENESHIHSIDRIHIKANFHNFHMTKRISQHKHVLRFFANLSFIENSIELSSIFFENRHFYILCFFLVDFDK